MVGLFGLSRSETFRSGSYAGPLCLSEVTPIRGSQVCLSWRDFYTPSPFLFFNSQLGSESREQLCWVRVRAVLDVSGVVGLALGGWCGFYQGEGEEWVTFPRSPAFP